MEIMPSNGLAPQLEAHEDRLQRVEAGVSDLRVRVTEVSCKQDLHHQLVMSKLEALTKVEADVEEDVRDLRKEKKHEKFGGVWELFPLKILRRYSIHLLVASGGALSHWVYTWWQHHG